MMIPRMRTLSAAVTFAILAFFVSSCSQPTGPAASGSNGFGVTTPPEHSSSNFNLAEPTLSGSQSGPGAISLSWTNGGATGPHIGISEVSGGEFYPVIGAWVGSEIKPNSGHTDIHMWNETLGVWEKIGSSKTGVYPSDSMTTEDLELTDLADGTYYFYAQEKSKLNASGNETETFHSNPSNVLEVEVISCVNVWSVNLTYPLAGWVQPSWQNSQQRGIHQTIANTIYQDKNTNANSRKFNFHFPISASCPGNAVTGRTVTVQVGSEAVITATEDLLNPGRYLANGIPYPNSPNTNVPMTILVDGQAISPAWQVYVKP